MAGLNEAVNQNPSKRYSHRIALASKTTVHIRKKNSELLTDYWDMNVDNNRMDVTLILNNQRLSAHKNVLASNSVYFDLMFYSSFKERFQNPIEMNIDVSYENFKSIIGYFYSGVLIITEYNVQDLLICSTMFLLDDVRDACVDYFETMISVENCIDMKHFANSLDLDNLHSICQEFIINNFRFVARTREYLSLDFDELFLIIQNDYLCAREQQVYDVVIKWINHDTLTRSRYSSELLWYVRLPLILNTYQGNVMVHELQGAKIDSLGSFRIEHRKSLAKGLLIMGHSPFRTSPEWYDATLDEWFTCTCENCHHRDFQTILAPPRPLCTCIVLDDGKLFAAGGYYSPEIERNLTYLFNPQLKQWLSLSPIKFLRIRPYIVQLGRKVFVVGGCCSTLSLNTIEYYDLNQEKWFYFTSRIEIADSISSDAFATSVDELIYFISNDKAEFYDTRNDSWHLIHKLPEKKKNAAICILNKNIYVIGGDYENIYSKSVWAYCTETEVWVQVADMNSPRSLSGAVAMNGFIYVLGGKTNDESYSNTFEVYNPHYDEWVTSSALMNVEQCSIDALVIEKNSCLFKHVFEV